MISDWIWSGTCYYLSRIEFQKVPVITDYLGFNSKKKNLLPTISDWIPKGTIFLVKLHLIISKGTILFSWLRHQK